jgi:TatA/E family protein of Tat protein translocase
MQAISENGVISASFFGGWEIVLILAVALILFAVKRLPDLGRGFRHGFRSFQKETRNLRDELAPNETVRGWLSLGASREETLGSK